MEEVYQLSPKGVDAATQLLQRDGFLTEGVHGAVAVFQACEKWIEKFTSQETAEREEQAGEGVLVAMLCEHMDRERLKAN